MWYVVSGWRGDLVSRVTLVLMKIVCLRKKEDGKDQDTIHQLSKIWPCSLDFAGTVVILELKIKHGRHSHDEINYI